MLQLQLKNLVAPKLSKKVTFFLKLSLCCCFVHVGVLAFLFLLVQSKVSVIINTHNNDASVLFVPFLKTAPAQKKVVQTSLLKKEVGAQQEATLIPVKKNNSVQPSKKSSQTIIKNKIVEQPVKKNIPEKKMQPQAQEKKRIVKKIEKVIPQKISAPKTINKEAATMVTQDQAQKSVQEPVIVGNEERELFVMQDTLKKDIVKKWKRPANIPNTALAEFRVVVHKNGSRDVIMEKSSQAMALDISARNFLLSYDFPELWCEKELSIIF